MERTGDLLDTASSSRRDQSTYPNIAAWKQCLSWGCYVLVMSLLLSYQLALLVMVSILIHEAGHNYAARRLGSTPKGIILIPMIGGMTTIDLEGRSLMDLAIVCLFGPIVSLIELLVLLFMAIYFESRTLAGWSIWIGIFLTVNLLPVTPLIDGGRIVDCILTSINYRLAAHWRRIGTVLFAYLLYTVGSWPLLGLMVIIGLRLDIFEADMIKRAPMTDGQLQFILLIYLILLFTSAKLTLLAASL